MVRSCLFITLIKCLKGRKSLGSLCNVWLLVVPDGPRDRQGHLLSCSGQLKREKDKKQMRQSGWSKYQISDGIEKIGCYTGAKHTASVLIIKQQWNHSWNMMTNPNINDLMKFKNSESQERQSQHLTDFYRWNWIFYLYLFCSGETK